MTVTLLHILRTVHTLIGAISTACLAYLYYAAWRRRRPTSDKLLIVALVWPLANLILMAANGMVCPLQNAAQVLVGQTGLAGQTGGSVRDIYLVPESWLRIIPWTYPIAYAVGAAAVWWRGRVKQSAASSASTCSNNPGR